MKDNYTVEYTNVKMGRFGHGKSKKKFLLKILFYNYPITYRCSIYKYCLYPSFFKSFIFYLKTKITFKKLGIVKKNLVVVITDSRSNCPRAVGVIRNGKILNQEIFMIHQCISLEYVPEDTLRKCSWIDLYNDFEHVPFEKLKLE